MHINSRLLIYVAVNHILMEYITMCEKVLIKQNNGTSGTTDLFCFYYRLHVSTYIQVIFRIYKKRVRNCYAWWEDDLYIGRNM
jgi:hypothetical protein